MIWRICCIGPDIVTTNWWCTILMEKNGMLIPFEIILTIFLELDTSRKLSRAVGTIPTCYVAFQSVVEVTKSTLHTSGMES
jgi:hypothetical protein